MSITKLALITGASSGLGMEYAKQLASKGYDLIIVARRKERLDALAADLQECHGIQVNALQADLSTTGGVKSVEEAIVAHPELSILVNNAGFGKPGRFAEKPIEDELDMVNVHIIATMRLTRAALPAMIANHSGSIINMSSVSAFTPAAGLPNYTATKGYLKNFSEGLATELYGTGVIVQVICPGLTHTEFHDAPEFQRSRFKERIPSMFWMTAEQVVAGSLRNLKHSSVFIPGFLYKLAAFSGTSGLLRLAMWLSYKLTGKPLTV